MATGHREGEARAVTATPVHIEPFAWASELAPADLAAVAGIWSAAWAEWVPGERATSPEAFVDYDRFTAHPEQLHRCLARADDGEVVGHGQVHWREGPGGGIARVFVAPPQRGRGIGRALFEELLSVARTGERSSLTLEAVEDSAAATMCAAAGLRPDMVMELNRTDPRAIPVDLLEGWRAAGEAAAGYSLEAYDVPCPNEAVAADFIHARHVMNDAPRWEGEPEATYTVDELLAVEAASVAAHQDWWNVGVRHDATGELVGISEVYLPRARPWIVFQGDTGVHPDHRGHGLGAWMKAVNHLRLRDERPDVEVVQTWNATGNEPMLRINRALGFAPVQRFQGWFLSME